MDGYNRTWQNEDGSIFYGFDDPSTKTTDWYDKNGYLDSTTDTPSDDEQTANNEGWLH
jgi:hypothetical protein